jgi:hypothetical protein
MPNKEQHRTKAEANKKFLATISLDDFPDWVVVAAFYTAVHLVEQIRHAAGDGDSTSHEGRLAYVQEKHPGIHTAYHQLQNASMLARYQSNATFFNSLQREDITDRLIARYLAEIEAYVRKFLLALSQTPPSGPHVASGS